MKYNLTFFLTFLVLWNTETLKASTKLDFATVDMVTYRCYQEKKWDSVILIGKQALRQDIDYYYLRVRMGISYFEKKEYFPASVHLKKARQFNSDDPVIANYLYYAYLYSGKEEEAGLVSADPGLKPGIFREVHAEGGYTLSGDKSPTNLATLMKTDSIYGEQDLYGNNSYSNLGLKLRVSKRIGLMLDYNYLNFNKTKYIQYGHSEAQRDSIIDNQFSRDYFYSYPWKIHDTAFKYNVRQHEIYIGAIITLSDGIRIMPAFHWINVGYNMVNPSYRVDSITDTAYYSHVDNTYHLFRYPLVVYSFAEKDTSFGNYVASLRITKDWGLFNVGLSGSWSNLNGKKQKQIGLSLTYYPFGNLNFYGTTAATGFFQGKSKRLLLSQVVGAKITSWMWAEANFYYGDYTNANIFNGSIVYNNSDLIDYRGGATLLFLAGKHLQFSLIYQYARKESQQIYYIKTEDPATKEINEIKQTQNNPYNTHSIIGGITWKF